jgi:flagellar hook assembly protein FlgD
VSVQIFTLAGKLIKTLRQTINTEGNRSSDVEWNGRDEYGDKIGRGVYLYKLKVTDPANKIAEKIEKLVIL